MFSVFDRVHSIAIALQLDEKEKNCFFESNMYMVHRDWIEHVFGNIEFIGQQISNRYWCNNSVKNWSTSFEVLNKNNLNIQKKYSLV